MQIYKFIYKIILVEGNLYISEYIVLLKGKNELISLY